MKAIRLITICLLALIQQISAQNTDDLKIKFQVRELNRAIFETRDSAVLVELLHDSLSYGHSGGKVENRAEAIRNILSNPNRYENLQMTNEQLTIDGRTAIARHDFSALQTVQGKQSELHLRVMQVWVRNKSEWKLIGRQSVKLEASK